MRRPTLTLVTQWFPPEQAPFGQMMRELAADLTGLGWDVTVITGFPNHPGGIVYAGFSKRWLSEESMEGVRVCRVWLATSPRRSLLNRLATFATFTLTASWQLLRRPRSDVLFAVLQPLSVGLTLPFAARFKGSRLVFNVQDLHPDAQIRLGLIRNRLLISVLRWLEGHAYRHCAAVSSISEAFRRHVVARGASAATAVVIGNWIDTGRIRPNAASGSLFRAEFGIGRETFVALWAGTIGHIAGASVLVDAAELLRERRDICFLVIGEGPMQPALRERAAGLGLNNMVFLPFQSEDKLLGVQNCADVALLTLAPDLADVSVPSKVLAYLSAGKPVVAAVAEGSETATLLSRSEAARIVPAGDGRSVAEAVLALATEPAAVARMGAAARRFAEENFSRPAAAQRYHHLFTRLLDAP